MAASAWDGKIQDTQSICVVFDAEYALRARRNLCFSPLLLALLVLRRKKKRWNGCEEHDEIFILGNRFVSATWWRGKRIKNIMCPNVSAAQPHRIHISPTREHHNASDNMCNVCVCVWWYNIFCAARWVRGAMAGFLPFDTAAAAAEKDIITMGKMWRFMIKMTMSTKAQKKKRSNCIIVIPHNFQVLPLNLARHSIDGAVAQTKLIMAIAYAYSVDTYGRPMMMLPIDYIKCYKYPY